MRSRPSASVEVRRHRPPFSELPELAFIGAVKVRRAGQLLLQPHTHHTMEICLIQKGSVWWWAGEEFYEVPGGHVYVTWPFEPHGAEHGVCQPSSLFWAGVPLWHRGQHNGRSFLNLPVTEARQLMEALTRLPSRCFPAPPELESSYRRILSTVGAPRDRLTITETRAALLDLLLCVVRGARATASPYSLMVRESLKLMESNLERPLPLSELSRRLGWSPTYFNRKFRAEVGTPPANYYLRRRIAEACRRLHADGRAITEIGLELGFGSSQYFATAFKRTMGITPQAFRRKPARPVKVSD